MRIAFIGAGKMAEAMISRLTAHQVIASDVDKKRLGYLRKTYRIKVTEDNAWAFDFGAVVVLAVKPQNVADVAAELALQIKKAKQASQLRKKIIVSIAAGIPLNYLQKKLPGASIVRAMPNNPCLVGAGMTALAKGKRVTRYALRVTKKIFEAVGEVIEVPEKWMDAVTGLSGSGPAFVYDLIEALTEGGIASGLPKKVAAKLAVQTVIGAAETVKHTGRSPRELRAMVASPGGTTIEGLKVLEKFKTARAFSLAVQAATKKSKLLSKRLGT